MQVVLGILVVALAFVGVVTNLMPELPFNAGTLVVDSLYALVAVCCLCGPLRRERFRELKVPLVLYGLLALWCLGLAVFGPGELSQRVLGFRNNIVYPGIWLLVGLSARRLGFRRLVETAWYAGLVICAFAICQFYFRHEWPDSLMLLGKGETRFGFAGVDIFRVTGLVGNTIVFTGFSAFVLLLGWMRPERERSLLQKLLTVIPAYALYLTYTRTANVSILLSWGFAWSCLQMKSIRRSVLRAATVAAILYVILGGNVGSTPEAAFLKFYVEKVKPHMFWDDGNREIPFLFKRMRGEDESSQGSTNMHIKLIKEGWALIKAHPLLGVGLGSQGYSSKAPPEIYVMKDGYWMATMLEFGAPGLLIWLAFLTWIFWTLLKEFNRHGPARGREPSQYVSGALILVFAFFAIASLLNSSYSGRTNQCLVWTFVGCVLSEILSRREQEGPRPRLLVVNGGFLAKPTTGLGRFAAETLLALDAQIGPGRVVLVVPRRVDVSRLPALRNVEVLRYGFLTGVLWEQFCLGFFAVMQGAQTLNLCNTAPVARTGIVCIHDIFYRTRAEDFQGTLRGRLSGAWHRWQYAWCARHAERILTVSAASAREIARVYGGPAGRIDVLGNGWEHMRRIASDASVFARLGDLERGAYYLALGSRAPNKNLAWVYAAARRHPDLRFVVAGGAFASAAARAEALPNVLVAGRVTDGEMKALLENCAALLFPSLDEGFGIPPLEALAVGRPVLAARIPVLVETYGDAVHWIDRPGDSAGADPRELLKSPVGAADGVLARNSWTEVARRLCGVLEASGCGLQGGSSVEG